MKTKYFALNAAGDIVSLGEYEDFSEADDKNPGAIWIVDEASAKVWWISLSVFANKYGWNK
jgi:hypothetical protein